MERFGTESEKFRHDVSLRPDEASLDAYDRVPVDEYGMGMLMGMGWKPGEAIGKSNKKVIDPIEFIPRASKLGLGATPVLKDEKKIKKYIKPGESREEKVPMGATPGPDGKVRHYKSINERLIPIHRLQLKTGVLVEVRNGPHRKLYGRVDSYDSKTNTADGQPLSIRLNLNQEVVTIPKEWIEILDEHALPEDHPAFLKNKPAAVASSASQRRSPKKRKSRSRSGSPAVTKKKKKNSKSQSRSRSRSRSRSKEKLRKRSPVKNGKSQKNKEKSKKKIKKQVKKSSPNLIRWVRPQIRVRVISKKLGGGVYYNKKARVEDVVSQSAFVVVMEEGGRLVEDVHEDDVETVVPKIGGRVMILSSSQDHRGEIGKILEKSTKKATAFVQLEGDLDIVQIGFDDIAEYMGGGFRDD